MILEMGLSQEYDDMKQIVNIIYVRGHYISEK